LPVLGLPVLGLPVLGLPVAGVAVPGLTGRASFGAGLAIPLLAAIVFCPAAVRPAALASPADLVVAALAVAGLTVIPLAIAADFAATDFPDMVDFVAATDFPAADLAAPPDLAESAAIRADPPPRFGVDGVDGLGTAGRVVVVVRAVEVAGFRAAAAATFFPADAVAAVARAAFPAPVVALVGAFLAAAIRVFLLANDCGLVSAWRLRIPAWTQGVAEPVLADLPGPAGILGVPLRIALLDCFECPRRFVGRGVSTEPVLGGTKVVAGLDTVVAKAPEVAASAGPTVVHAITLHLKPTIRHRFG
jgi:hypothetical protein